MSKMSQLHVELSEQASELGFETIQDAINSGYIVDYEKGKLVKRGLGYSETVKYLMKEQELAHEAWLKEKEQVLNDLDIVAHSDSVPFEHKEIVKQAIEFIRKGEC